MAGIAARRLVLLWRHVPERLVGEPEDPSPRAAAGLLLAAASGSVDDEQLAAVLTVAG